MNMEHAPEMELQQYVLDKNGCSSETIAHIETCASCQAATAAYRLVITGLDQQPTPAFDFDLSALVLAALPVSTPALASPAAAHPVPAPVRGAPGLPQPAPPADRPSRVLTAAAIFFITGIPVWLFRKNIFYTFTGISSFFLFTIVSAALFILVWRIARMYRRYQQRMSAILYY